MIHLLPTVYIARTGPDIRYIGDNFEQSAVIIRDGKTAIVQAWTGGTAKAEEMRELGRKLREEGFTHIQWDRYRSDGTHHKAYRRL